MANMPCTIRILADADTAKSIGEYRGPAHLNVCFEEPLTQEFKDAQIFIAKEPKQHIPAARMDLRNKLNEFLSHSDFPFVVVAI